MIRTITKNFCKKLVMLSEHKKCNSEKRNSYGRKKLIEALKSLLRPMSARVNKIIRLIIRLIRYKTQKFSNSF